ncbi:hypothetical protein NEHOM01_0921 [Nematocida homosporus]|uniref:uncharacterized protein n=1 Tax=Nematocida homosporus TaxID=1912981 RepID=UPI002220DBFB|nr:uncharacterized protein NEHOM01_0921 [Nematocida homosporus]KAI5185595.1 hypothetical protein NEHOM01_0921 [Nematocida homosporus]
MQEKRERGLSVRSAIFPMVGSIMGSGVLNLPQSVELSGYLMSGPLLAFISAVSAFTLFQLVHCAKQLEGKGREPSYFLVCKTAFPVLGYAADGFIGIQGLGCCFCYFLILKSWISKLLGWDTYLEQNLLMNLIFSAGLMAIPGFMATLKDLKKLNFASVLCTISVLYLSLLVLVCGGLALWLPPVAKTAADSPLRAYTTEPSKLFAALSKYVFALGCQQNMVRVFSLLDRPTVGNGAKVGAGAVGVAAFVFFLVSNGGYLAGGNGQKESILDVLENKNKPFYQLIVKHIGEKFFWLVTLAKIGMATVLFAGYPIQMHPSRDAVLTFVSLGLSKSVAAHRRWYEVGVVVLVSLAIMLGSLTSVQYSFVMSLISTTASCYIMFALPSIAYLMFPKKTPLFTGISVAILAGSILFSIIGTKEVLESA